MQCHTCREEKEETAFARGKKICRKCQSIYYREWYVKNGRKTTYEPFGKVREWMKANPEKVKAHYILGYAVRSGKIYKPKNCEKCNREVKLYGHHEDYSKIFSVSWLCGSCHKLEHLQPTPLDIL